MSTVIKLAASLDTNAAPSTWSAFNAARGEDLDLDASEVMFIGGMCLQVLLAAREAWEADGKRLRVASPSVEFEQSMSLFAAEHLLASGGVA